jgi:hypothetical protein
LACNYKLNYIKIWNLTSGQLVQTLKQSYNADLNQMLNNYVKCLILLANGNLVSVTEKGYIHIWFFSNSRNSTGLFICMALFVTEMSSLKF